MRAARQTPAVWGTLALLGWLSAASLAAAHVAPLAVFVMTADDSGGESGFDNLDIIDSSLNGKLGITRVGSDVGDNKLLAVFAGLKNKTSHQLAIEVETIYKDKDGNPLNAGSWIPMTLQPHEEKEYRSASISLDAIDFLVRVRRESSSSAPPVLP